MIPMLILYVIKKIKNDGLLSEVLSNIKKFAVKLKLLFFLLIVTYAYSNNEKSTDNLISYNVVKNNDVIGTISIHKNVLGNSTTYSLDSNIEARFLLKFKVSGKEKSIFEDGVLTYSSVYRKVNNKVKTNHSICLKNGAYNLQTSKTTKTLELNFISQNLITMYFDEPIGLRNIFCDNLSELVPVKALGNGVYKVQFENDKYNLFYYKNGKCVKIEVFSSLFNVTLIPA